MFNLLLTKLQKKSAEKKAALFESFFAQEKESVLDFGCGDLTLAKALYKKNKHLSITGIDVVDFRKKLKGIAFKKYSGKKIPYKDNSFDTVISVYVFHHCVSAEVFFNECLRVAKKRVIIMEAVAHTKGEIPFMKFIDWLSNAWKGEDIPMTYQFLTFKEWKKVFSKAHASLATSRQEKNIISCLPIGKTIIFEVSKHGKR